MLDYFRRSQGVRQEIEADERLLAHAAEIIEAGPADALLGDGAHNKVYSLGQTASGLFLALRMPNDSVLPGDLAGVVQRYEDYCQMGAMSDRQARDGVKHPLYNRVIRPVRFCVAAMHQGTTPAIITEDVSEGGRFEVVNKTAEQRVMRYAVDEADEDPESVLVDLDDLMGAKEYAARHFRQVHPGETQPQYFDDGNRINLPTAPSKSDEYFARWTEVVRPLILRKASVLKNIAGAVRAAYGGAELPSTVRFLGEGTKTKVYGVGFVKPRGEDPIWLALRLPKGRPYAFSEGPSYRSGLEDHLGNFVDNFEVERRFCKAPFFVGVVSWLGESHLRAGLLTEDVSCNGAHPVRPFDGISKFTRSKGGKVQTFYLDPIGSSFAETKRYLQQGARVHLSGL